MQGCSAADLLNSHRCSTQAITLGEGISVNVFTIPGATIIGERYPLVFAPPHSTPAAVWESHLIRPNFDWDLENNLNSSAWSEKARPTTLDTAVLFLAGPGTDNFYHWMHDCMPRLIAAQRAGIDAPILIPASSEKNSFIRESLSLLGIPDDKVIEHPGGKVIAPAVILVEDLFYHTPIQAHHRLLNEVRERFLSAVGITPSASSSHATDRIFLSREGSGSTRTIINQIGVESLLSKHGFRKVQMEKLPLTDQIRLIANAAEVVAPHGAGLFHTLFMSNGHVIEFFPQHPEAAKDPSKKLVEPCWFRILACHAENGRSVTWEDIKCDVEMLSATDFNQYRLNVDLPQLQERLNGWRA